ncbi:cobalt ABC transporter ATP-binding protein, partial [Klebsiella pneumoniae]
SQPWAEKTGGNRRGAGAAGALPAA